MFEAANVSNCLGASASASLDAVVVIDVADDKNVSFLPRGKYAANEADSSAPAFSRSDSGEGEDEASGVKDSISCCCCCCCC